MNYAQAVTRSLLQLTSFVSSKTLITKAFGMPAAFWPVNRHMPKYLTLLFIVLLMISGLVLGLKAQAIPMTVASWEMLLYHGAAFTVFALPITLARVVQKTGEHDNTMHGGSGEPAGKQVKPKQKPGPEIETQKHAEEEVPTLHELLEQMVERRFTGLTQANKELKRMNSLYESVQNAAGIGTWEVDLATKELYWSSKVYQIHELETTRPIQLEESIRFFHPDHRPILERAVHNCIQNGKKYDLELVLVTSKGRHTWVNITGMPVMENGKTVKIRGLSKDIDEKKRHRQRLEDQVRQVSLAMDAGEIGTWNWSIKDDKLHWNAYMYKHFDWPKEEFGGRYSDFIKRLAKNDQEKVESAIQRSLDTTSGRHHIELDLVCRDNSVRNLVLDGLVVRDFIGKPVNIVGTCFDISGTKKEQALQLEAISQELESFNYSVSHDLRSPLRSIKGFAQALLEDSCEILDANTNRYVERIANSAARMNELIDNLLHLSHLSQREVVKQEIDISRLCHEIIQECELDKRYEVSIQEGLAATGDAKLVKVMLESLVSNAVKYSSKKRHPKIEIGIHQEGGCFFIKDNGAGFDMKYADRLFGAFQRLHSKQEFEGTGIGLATVQRVINKHGGRTWAESEPGKGATFFFTLNQHEDEKKEDHIGDNDHNCR